ncbi:MFS transporter [Staphylococcus coagulans]|uniref:MFS transporter n=1 Tax=Staphylococcus coagulans TaxID=74706 RepID=UPI001BEC1872|nr:MFS transporter [Staphylococcus coagulans]MBT2830326.1 MFS transporter [Staphylococcus coagulans]MBT2859625.1 MFS transporter [Staphylococcus coagulans]MBU3872269.1 MFS transporter [Staphylococcus coagulans]UNB49213.1 MFS transporter [Staphylococcus coagulans]
MNEYKLTQLFIGFNTSILSGIALFSPVIYIFLINLGYSFTEAGLYLSIFWGAAAISELPTGILADTIGQKRVVIYSCLMRACGLILLVSENFFLLIVSGLITGVAESMLSGSLGSWYMNQLTDKKAMNLERVFSKVALFGSLFSLVVGFISAEYLFKININLPIILSALYFIVLSYLIYILLPERKGNSDVENLNAGVLQIKSIWFTNFKKLISIFRGDKSLVLILIMLVVPTILDIGPSNQWQVAFKSNIAYLWVGISLIGMLTNLIIPKIPKIFDGLKEIMVYIFIDIIIIFIMTHSEYSTIFFMVHIIIFTIISVKTSVYMHRDLVKNDSIRSSFISTFYTIESIVTMSLLPFNGYVSERRDVFYAWETFVYISLFLIIINFIILKTRYKKH